MKQLILDIGGTYIKYAYFDNDKINVGSFPVKNQDGKEDVPGALHAFLKKYQVDELGVSVPGPFDFKNNISLMTFKLNSIYHVNMMDIFRKHFPKAKIVLIHDAVAFILGVLIDHPEFKNKKIAGIMLGTGIGYAYMEYGRVKVDEAETTFPCLGRQQYLYKDRIIEDYMSATGLIRLAKEIGYDFHYIKEMAEAANKDQRLMDIFHLVGRMLGKTMNKQQETDHFTDLIIGGGVSNVWALIKPGFEETSKIPYQIIKDSTMCPINGVRLALKLGKENIYLK